jgi:hypothetical protein
MRWICIEAGRTLRAALKSWSATARLCVVLLVAAGAWCLISLVG